MNGTAAAAYSEFGELMPVDGGDSEELLTDFVSEGVDIDALGIQLQNDGAQAFVNSWNDLLKVMSSKRVSLRAS